MGVESYFLENVDRRIGGEIEACAVQLDLADCSDTPEIRIGPKNAASDGYIASFGNLKQFERFADAVHLLYLRTKGALQR